MLAENEALLVSGLEEFGSSELMATELGLEVESPPSAQLCLYESALIKRLRAGEMYAFNELVEEYQSLVYALALRILGDAEDARDATQETFLKIYRHFPRFRGDASLKTWICRIAINQARSTERWWRRRHRGETTSLDMPLPSNGCDDHSPHCQGDYLASPSATPETATLTRERGRQIEIALGQLKRDFRIAVILRDIEGLSYDEIAYVTGVSVGTIKSRISRGREMLRERVQGLI